MPGFIRREIAAAIFLAFFGSFLFTIPSFAVFDLNVTPSDGGFDLRFPRISATDFKQTKEITLRMTSNIGKQYRISQQVIKPLSTFDGTTIPEEQFKMYPLVNSNSRGTLLYREEAPVSTFDTILYTSDTAGNSDSFRLVYTLTPFANQVAGTYYGRIAYILTPINSTQAQVVVNLNVYADLAAGTVAAVEVTTASGSHRIGLSSRGMGPQAEQMIKGYPQVSVKVNGQLGAAYRIFASLEGNSIMSNAGDEFDLSKVQFSLAGGDKGSPTRDGDFQAAATKELLYTSDAVGSGDDFVMTFKPAQDFRLAKAGLYKGKLDFIIEKLAGMGKGPEVVGTLDLEFDIVPLFDIRVYSQGREGVNLSFGEVSYKTGPKQSDVDVYVDSNMGKPYQVVQNVAGPMANEKLEKIPEEDFTVKVKDIEGINEPKSYIKDFIPAKQGETVLLASSPSGDSQHFTVEYQLNMRPDTKGGNYSTRIGYSLALN